MHYARIKTFTTTAGPGMRTALYVSGSRHDNDGSEFHPFDYGDAFVNSTYDYILRSMEMTHVAGLSILGGEPLEPENQLTVLTLMERVRKAYPEKTIWVWTRFPWKELTSPEYDGVCRARTVALNDILKLIDVLVTFDFQSQTNIDVSKSLEQEKVVLWDEDIHNN